MVMLVTLAGCSDTPYDIVVNRLDVSQRGDGILILKDKARGTSANPFATIYRKTASGVTVQSGGASPVAGSDNMVYQPQDGWRYGWSVGQETADRVTTTYRTSSWLGIDALAADLKGAVAQDAPSAQSP